MKKIVFSILFTAFSLSCFSQSSFFDNYVYQSWSEFGGLSGTTANDIYQTSDGYINIGTYEGLVKFDGVEFHTLNRINDKDYGFASARTIIQDKAGNTWIGSNDEGVHRVSETDCQSYTMENGLPNNSVRALCEDTHGNIWIGTAAGVVYITPDGKLINPQFGAGTTANGVIASNLFCDKAGKVWLTTSNENGLFRCEDGVFKPLDCFEKFSTYFATAIFQDHTGIFWIGLGDHGIATMLSDQVTLLKTGTLLDDTPASTILEDSHGVLWFGTEHGLVVYANGKFEEYKGAQELAGSNINRIIQDREDNIWFATDRNGIGKMTHGKFIMHRLGVTVNAIAEAPDGKIWAATDNGVLCFNKNDEAVENTLTRYTKDLRVRHIEVTSDGKILVSCYTKPGQLLYDGKTIKSWDSDHGLAGNKVRVAIESAKDEYYVGTTTGLSIIHKDGSIDSFKQNTGELDTEYVMTIYKDTHGVFWIGTDGGGIFLMRDEKIFSHITSADGIAGNVIFKITQDAKGNFWICTGSGITRIKDFDTTKTKRFESSTINSENGIGTNSVFQIMFDSLNNAWITNNHGIASLSVEELEEYFAGERQTLTTKYYNRNDGLDSDGVTSTALAIIDSKGRLWVPLVDGIAVYDPQKVRQSDILPLVQIETITVDSVPYKNTGDTIILKPGTKRIDIKYTGFSFDAPERLIFSHMLTGFDTDYTLPSSERIVSYTNLTPGKHSFIVYAINGNGLQSDNQEVMFFYQKPYIYQRPLFWIILISLMVGAGIAFFMIREHRIKMENLRLEALVQARTADLAIEKDKSDKLLRSILPDKIADKLRETAGSKAFGEDFENVTILFSDIVGFTKVSSGHSAKEIVKALNDMFSRFDERAKKIGVEKIRTIGDAYMAACGVPEANENHARIMIDFAKGMLEDLAEYNKTADIHFQIRIGLNCGPVTAGVIGTHKFIYDVWGNTVNVASRMETAANPDGIRITEELKKQLKGEKGLKFSRPVECEVKGKGKMKTYDVL